MRRVCTSTLRPARSLFTTGAERPKFAVKQQSAVHGPGAVLRSLSSAAAAASAAPASSASTEDKATFSRNLDRLRKGEPVGILSFNKPETKGCEVFAHTDTALNFVKVYGFDYDFTLASYNDRVLHFIYDAATKYLVDQRGYPKEILTRKFDKSFAVRGLNYDERTGYLFKMDQFGKIQIDTVHHGRKHVPLKEVISAYRGQSVTKSYAKQYLHMMTDIFCLPEACLVADIAQVFLDSKYEHSPRYIYRDIRDAIDFIHGSGLLHNAIINEPAKYLEDNPQLGTYLMRLRNAGKKVFLLTNSPFKFVDAGMQYMLRDALKQHSYSSWLEYFDIVICSARKPSFFDRDAKFRKLNTETGALSFQAISEFKRGEVYTEGGLAEFTRLTGSTGSNVLYMGDHVFADLVRPNKTAMWKTCAIVKELQTEMEIMSRPSFKTNLQRLLEVEKLIDYGQRLDDVDSREQVAKLKEDRAQVRKALKEMFNKHFGSLFRTYSHRTMFFFNVGTHADIYTSNVINFLEYPPWYCFYAGRTFFPHEVERGGVNGNVVGPQTARAFMGARAMVGSGSGGGGSSGSGVSASAGGGGADAAS